MDILLDNPLTNMYGPYFLVLYSFATLFTILFFGFFRSRLDQSDRLPLPSIPSDIDPYEIAYLRGGVNEMARTAVFSLVRNGLLEIITDGKRPMITRTSVSQWRGMATVEDAALNWFVVSHEPKAIFAGGGLTEVLEPYADEYLRRLGRQQLIAGTEMQKRLSAWRRPAYAVILALGGYKAFASIINGYFNLLGILAIAIIGVIAIYYVGRLPWLTKLGKAYLDRLRTAFEKLRYLGEAEKPGMAGQQTPAAMGGPAFDPMLLSVGIFGSGVLVGTAYGAHDDLFAKSRRDEVTADGGSNGSGTACGSACSASGSTCSSGGNSCSSGGSSCSSSGCSSGCGGGGCGGGCGGS